MAITHKLLLIAVALLPGAAAKAISEDATAHAVERCEVGRFVVRFSLIETTADAAEAAARASETSLREVERLTGISVPGPISLILHADADALRRRTGAPAGTEALTVGRATVHQPLGFTGGHEMVHVAARHLPRAAGASETEAFWEEGLATALAPPLFPEESASAGGSSREPTLRERASVEARLGLLPSPTALLLRWPEEQGAASRAYRAAGAFVADLLEQRGMEAVLRRVAGHDDVAAFGADLAHLEREWFESLLDTPLAEDVETRVRGSLGLPIEAVQPGAAEGPPLPFQGEDHWLERGGGRWERDGDVLRASAGERLATRILRERLEGDVTLSMRLRLEEGATLAVRLHVTDEGSDEVLFGPADTALTVDGGSEGFLRSPVRVLPGRWTGVIIECRGPGVRVYLDGRLVLEGEGAFRPAPGRIGFSLTPGSRAEIAEATCRGSDRPPIEE